MYVRMWNKYLYHKNIVRQFKTHIDYLDLMLYLEEGVANSYEQTSFPYGFVPWLVEPSSLYLMEAWYFTKLPIWPRQLPLFLKFWFLQWCSHFHSLFFYQEASSIKAQSSLQQDKNGVRVCHSCTYRNTFSVDTSVIRSPHRERAVISFAFSCVTVGMKSISKIFSTPVKVSM